MPSEEILKKVIGDYADESVESLYRTAASALVNGVYQSIQSIDSSRFGFAIKTRWWHIGTRLRGRIYRPRDINTIEGLLMNLTRNKPFGEAAISFALAVGVEFFPLKIADDIRKRLAYNLRVRTWEKLEEGGFRRLPVINNFLPDAAERTLFDELAKRGLRVEELKSGVQGAVAVFEELARRERDPSPPPETATDTGKKPKAPPRPPGS
jgi:hypothetical protein